MPSLGADMDAGTLLEWLVEPGDAVHRGDIVAVVDTDKAAIEVECFEDGLIDQLTRPAGAEGSGRNRAARRSQHRVPPRQLSRQRHA